MSAVLQYTSTALLLAQRADSNADAADLVVMLAYGSQRELPGFPLAFKGIIELISVYLYIPLFAADGLARAVFNTDDALSATAFFDGR